MDELEYRRALDFAAKEKARYAFDPSLFLHSIFNRDALESRRSVFLSGQYSTENPRSITSSRLLEDLNSWCRSNVPAYRNYPAAASFDDLATIDKSRMQVEKFDFLNRDPALSDVWRAHTFGTTSAPVEVFYDPAFYFDYLHLTVWKTCFQFLEKTPSTTVFCVSIDNDKDGENFLTIDPHNSGLVTLKINIDEMNSESFRILFDEIARLGPTVIASRPSVYEAVAAFFLQNAEQGIRLSTPSVKCVFSAGSFLSEQSRIDVETCFGASVVNCYGLAEFGFVAGECPLRHGYHIDPTNVLIEGGEHIRGATSDELIISSSRNTAMPLLRFKTGDRAIIDHSSCPCGRVTPRIISIRGHGPFYFEIMGGHKLHPSRLYPIRWNHPISEFSVHQTSTSSFLVRVKPADSFQIDCLPDIQSDLKALIPGEVELNTVIDETHHFSKETRFSSSIQDSMVGRDIWPGGQNN